MKATPSTSSGDTFANRILIPGTFVVLALSFAAAGCAEEKGNTSGSGGAPVGTGGSTSSGSGGAPAGSGGATTAGSGGAPASGSGGSSTTGSGGAPVGTGGAPSSGSGGASSGSGGAVAGTGGAGTGTGGGAGPAAVCTSQAKGGACLSPTDACAKNCGPKNAANINIGSKTLTCSAAAYVEGTCDFPAVDQACFKVTATTPACPAATASSGACTVPSCMPCSGYVDSTQTAKVGYCHCVNAKWSCGSTKEWPCQVTGVSTSPGGTGC